MRARWDSNPDQPVRSRPHYPLCYGPTPWRREGGLLNDYSLFSLLFLLHTLVVEENGVVSFPHQTVFLKKECEMRDENSA